MSEINNKIDKAKIKRFIKKSLILFSAFILLFAVFYAYYFFYSPPLKDTGKFNKGKNAIWIGHKWFAESHADNDIEELISTIDELEVKTVYIHTGPIDAKGNIPKYNLKTWLYTRAIIKEKLPEVALVAWLGGLNREHFGEAEDTLDLSDEKLISSICTRVSEMINVCLFDGIHYDIEPLFNNDENFINLLKKTRETIGDKKILSVASSQIAVPESLIKSADFAAGRKVALWGAPYYKKVAQNCDEIAVMAYDTLSPTTASYEKYMAYQVKNVTDAINDTSCKLFIGIPTYEEKTRTHNPNAEKIDSGLKGVIIGLNKSNKVSSFEGVAIYALWTTDKEEIQKYKKIWLGK